MDVHERLSLDAVSSNTLIASEHIQRYEFAADLCKDLRVVDLCCGVGYGAELMSVSASLVHGVDNDVATIETASATAGVNERMSFQAADAVSFLREDLSDRFDAIVCFEGLEHLPDVGAALDELHRLAAGGMRIVASVPNSRAFDEENEFHATDFGYEEARKAFAGFDEAVFITQYLAEGSLLCMPGAEAIEARLVNAEYAEPEHANHYIVTINFDADAVHHAYRGRMQLAVAPVYNRHMRNLERANNELWRHNTQLARNLIGKADSAAASFTSKLERRVSALEAELEQSRRVRLDETEAHERELKRQAAEFQRRLDMADAEIARRDGMSVRETLREQVRRRHSH